jgi:PAS domain S-box-containing protein
MYAGRRKTLLLVEDEAVQAMLQKKTLEMYGYTVCTANTGEKAVALLDADNEIDLILMDIDLGKGIDGTQAAEIILRKREIPVVFLSSHTESEIVGKTEKITSYGYVVKNSSITVLDASIKMAFKLFDSNRKTEISEERYRSLLTNLDTGVVVHNADTSIAMSNSRASELLGLSAEQMEGTLAVDPKWHFLDEKNAPMPLEEYPVNRILTGRKSMKNQILGVNRPANGDVIWLLVNGIPVFDRRGGISEILISFIDITDRKLAERALQNKNEEYEVLNEELRSSMEELHITTEELQSLNEELRVKSDELDRYFTMSLDLLCIADTEGRFLRLNPEWETVLGYSIEDLNGTSLLDLVHPDDKEKTMEALALLASQEQVLSFENRYRCRNGRYRWIEWRSHPQGNIVYAAARDITDRKAAGDAVRSLLVEKELLLREVHHRIKNNMNTIYGLLILQAGSMKDALAADALEDSGRRVKSMMVLYDKLYKSANFAELSVEDYFSPLIDEIVCNFPNREAVTINKKFGAFILESNILQPMGIIINELLTNCMKYAFTGRTGGTIDVSAVLKESMVTLTIGDNGNGIDSSITPGNSAGFGLVLVDALAQQLAGNIRIERGSGTRIVLEFEK